MSRLRRNTTLRALLNCLATARAENPRPDILFILADDLRPSFGAAYGDGKSGIATPHLDRLAASSVVFDRAYCQAPSCNPSRSSFMSGLAPDTSKIYWFEAEPDEAKMPSIFQALRTSGYVSLGVGKLWHRNPNAEEAALAFSPENGDFFPRTYLQDWGSREGVGRVAAEKLEAAARARRAGARAPFVLGVGFHHPHLKWHVPRDHWERHANASVGVPKHRLAPAGWPVFAKPDANIGNEAISVDGTPIPSGSLWPLPLAQWTRRPPTWDALLYLRRGYGACVALVDDNVGRVLETARREGLLDNAVVVFSSDHGYALGEHGSWGKGGLFDMHTRVPLLISAPGVAPRREGRVVGLLDMMRCFRAAGQHNGAWGDYDCKAADGGAFRKDAYDGAAGPRTPLMGYAARSNRWRYVAWYRYDLDCGDVRWRERPWAEELYRDADDIDDWDHVNLLAPGAPSSRSPQLLNIADAHLATLRLVVRRRRGRRASGLPPSRPTGPGPRATLRLTSPMASEKSNASLGGATVDAGAAGRGERADRRRWAARRGGARAAPAAAGAAKAAPAGAKASGAGACAAPAKNCVKRRPCAIAGRARRAERVRAAGARAWGVGGAPKAASGATGGERGAAGSAKAAAAARAKDAAAAKDAARRGAANGSAPPAASGAERVAVGPALASGGVASSVGANTFVAAVFAKPPPAAAAKGSSPAASSIMPGMAMPCLATPVDTTLLRRPWWKPCFQSLTWLYSGPSAPDVTVGSATEPKRASPTGAAGGGAATSGVSSSGGGAAPDVAGGGGGAPNASPTVGGGGAAAKAGCGGAAENAGAVISRGTGGSIGGGRSGTGGAVGCGGAAENAAGGAAENAVGGAERSGTSGGMSKCSGTSGGMADKGGGVISRGGGAGGSVRSGTGGAVGCGGTAEKAGMAASLSAASSPAAPRAARASPSAPRRDALGARPSVDADAADDERGAAATRAQPARSAWAAAPDDEQPGDATATHAPVEKSWNSAVSARLHRS
ncbi:sulfuric ester hydrolase [Aureococcus anophagefferens]|nr:sulfuric ester hydrolase [Aureococcus anophagefferens]